METSKVHLSTDRSRNYYKQVRWSFVFKFFSIFLSLLLVPLMIDYVGIMRFGIWATMTAILRWVVFFDLGLGNGLRNTLANALAQNQRERARAVISTCYFTIGAITLTILVLLYLMTPILNLRTIFNAHLLNETELKWTLLIIGTCIIINFLLSLINYVLHASQRSSFVVLSQFSINLLALCFTLAARAFLPQSLVSLAAAYGMGLLIANFSLNFWFFYKNDDLKPRIRFFDSTQVRSLTNLGVQFFIIQVAVMIVFSTDKIIISHLFGPSSVTGYEVSYKLFGLVTIAQSIIITPLWSAYTHAHAQGDMDWIKNKLYKLNLLLLPLTLGILFLIIFGPKIIEIWIGKDLGITSLLLWTMGGFTFIRAWNNIYAIFLNGIGKIGLQVKIAIIQSVMNIPLSIFLGRRIGVSGVLLATIISLSLFAIAGPIQTLIILGRERRS